MPCQISSDQGDRITAGSVILCSVLGSIVTPVQATPTGQGHVHTIIAMLACSSASGTWEVSWSVSLSAVPVNSSRDLAPPQPLPRVWRTQQSQGGSCASCLLGTSPQPCQIVLLLAPLLKGLVTGWFCPGLQCTLGQRRGRDWDWLLPAYNGWGRGCA